MCKTALHSHNVVSILNSLYFESSNTLTSSNTNSSYFKCCTLVPTLNSSYCTIMHLIKIISSEVMKVSQINNVAVFNCKH